MEALAKDTDISLLDSWLSNIVEAAPHSSNQPSIDLPFQRWFKFKEAYSPRLVTDVVKEVGGKPGRIVDPFGGCGTTAITSQFLGVKPTAIEVNPFLADLTEAKLTNYDLQSLLKAKEFILSHVFSVTVSEEEFNKYPQSFVEPGLRGKWLYSKTLFETILKYKKAVSLIRDDKIRRLMKVILGSTLVPMSNIFISGKGRKYKDKWNARQSTPEEFKKVFELRLNQALRDISQFGSKLSEYELLRGDCRSRSNELGSFDLSIFSPPYPNSFDYTDVYNVELWLLGYISSHEECRKLRSNTLRSHVQVKRSYDFRQMGSRTLKETYDKLNSAKNDLWNPEIPDMVHSYFDDLYGLLDNMSGQIDRNGSVVMVVGDSAYKSIRVPVADILSEISAECGYKTKSKNVVRRMRTSAQQGGTATLDETIVWLSKT